MTWYLRVTRIEMTVKQVDTSGKQVLYTNRSLSLSNRKNRQVNGHYHFLYLGASNLFIWMYQSQVRILL